MKNAVPCNLKIQFISLWKVYKKSTVNNNKLLVYYQDCLGKQHIIASDEKQ